MAGKNREQRRRQRKIQRICLIVILVLLTLLIFSTALRLKTLGAFKGVYVRNIDITDEAVINAQAWLGEIEGTDIDAEWIRARMPEDMSLRVELEFDRKGIAKGSYTEKLDNISYSECEDKAYEAVSACLREVIVSRLTAVGYAESVTDEEADALINEALGMTLDNYLKNGGIRLLPDYDTLAADISRAGDYRIKGSKIKWERDGSAVSDRFITEGGSIAFPDMDRIYRREK